jgi:hypothetical protein
MLMNPQSLLRKSRYVLPMFVAGFLWWQPAAAQNVMHDAPAGDRWQSSLFVYLWTTGMDGTVAVGGNPVDVDVSFSDLFDVLDMAFAARFESQKGKWGYFIDGMYVKLDPSQNTPAGTVNVDVKDLIFEAGGIYQINPQVQALFGARYQDMSVDIFLPGPLPTVGGDQSWIDGFVGLRFIPVQTDKWRVWLRGDIGAGDSDFIWNAVLGAAYRFNKNWSGVLAYRVLSTDFQEGGFQWDIDMSGLGLAVGYSWR